LAACRAYLPWTIGYITYLYSAVIKWNLCLQKDGLFTHINTPWEQ